MSQTIKEKYLLTGIIIALFSYLSTMVQTWDDTNFRNLNTPLIVTWICGAGLLGGLITMTKPSLHVHKSILWAFIGVLISIIMLPALDYPMASLIAVPSSNMGVAQNIAGGVIAYSVYILCRDNPIMKNIIIACVALSLTIFTIITVLTTKPNGHNVFATWRDVHALVAMPSFIILAIGVYQSEKWVKYISMVGIAIVLYNIFISQNKTAQALVLLLPVIIGGLYAIDKLFPKNKTVIKALLNPLSILVTSGVLMAIIFLNAYRLQLDDSSTLYALLQTLITRSLLLNNYLIAIQYDIASLFTGFGWGTAREIQMNYGGLTSAIFETDNKIYALDDTRNIIVGGLGATSLHNTFFDLIAGIGIFGAMAFLLTLYHLGKACDKHPIVLGTWIILGAFYSVWFSTSVTVVPFFIAMGMTAALMTKENDEPCPHVEKIATPTVQKIIFALAMIMILFSAFYKIKQTNLLSKTIVTGKIAPELYYDNFYNQDSTNYQDSIKFFRLNINLGLEPLIAGKPLTNQQLLVMIDGIDLLKEKSDNGHPTMTAELLNIINLIMENGEEEKMLKARQKYFPIWEETLKKAVKQTPYRFYLWRPYLQTMYLSQQYQMVGNMAQYILKNGNPNDPMALYARGLAFRALGDEQSAKKDLQKALDYGITALITNAKNALKK